MESATPDNLKAAAKGGDPVSAYGQFLSVEYEQIASAYFKAVETLTSFFKHYLLIAGLPLSLFGLIFSEKVNQNDVPALKLAGGAAFLGVSLIGTLVLCYMSNLWFDQVLYARQVNGIRGYFARRSGASFSELSALRVLPITTSKPTYSSAVYFGWVALAAAFINAAYSGFAVFLLMKGNTAYLSPPFGDMIVALNGVIKPWAASSLTLLIVLGGNLVLYWRLAVYRERTYLQSQAIGIDIDGVLNMHREQFVTFLRKHTGKEVKPEGLVCLPVRKCAGLNITKRDEVTVFNDPEYWTQMPVDPNALSGIQAISRLFPRTQIRVYTHRPWPDYRGLSAQELEVCQARWKGEFGLARSMKRITRDWLLSRGFQFDHIFVEERTSSEDTRFAHAQDGVLRVFIEDDAINARRLAAMCDKVILIAKVSRRPVWV